MPHPPAHPVANQDCAQPEDSSGPAGQWSHLLHGTGSWTLAHLYNPNSRVSAMDSESKESHSPIASLFHTGLKHQTKCF